MENNPCLNAPNPCNNDGQCFYSQGSITCMCNEGFDGQRCEIDLCQGMTCPANAECRNGVCQCSEGFTSKYIYQLSLDPPSVRVCAQRPGHRLGEEKKGNLKWKTEKAT